MGTFCLFRQSRSEDYGREKRLLATFSKQGFSNPIHLQCSREWNLIVYGKMTKSDPVYYLNGRNCGFAVGTLIYREKTAGGALKRLFEDFRVGRLDRSKLLGQFCVGIHLEDKIYLFTDRLGVYRVYHDANKQVFSNSFLCIVELIERVGINKQSVYEYVIQGGTYGGHTFYEEVRTLTSDLVIDVETATIECGQPYRPNNGFANKTIDENIELNAHTIKSYARQLISVFGENISCALSGGYDTRLLLAALLNRGLLPKLHVYGASTDSDVAIALEISKAYNWPIKHIDKRQFARAHPDEFKVISERNFHQFDGFTYSGIFDNGADLQTRHERVSEGELYLNGGGGEIYRNFFHLRSRPYNVKEFLWSFYCQFDPRTFTSEFCEKQYLDNLKRKIREVLDVQEDTLRREQIEFLYPGFRGRFWMGRNLSLDNRFGSALTPFSDLSIVESALTVPVAQKEFGNFEARLIRELSPSLASHQSGYGYNFSRNTPLKKVFQECLTTWRPMMARKYAFRLKNIKKKEFSYYLTDVYLRSVLDTSFPYMSRFVRINRLKDEGQYNRVCTLEYLMQKHNASYGGCRNVW